MADTTVGLLRVILTANTAEFDSAMKKASDSAKVWSKDLGNIGQQATAIGRTLTTAVTLPLVALGAGAIKMATDFESSFAGVRKTVDATEPEFAQLAKGLREMSKETGTNVNELNKVAEAAGQLGIKKEDILQFTRTMADLSVTTNLTAEEAANATAQIQNIFGAAGKDVDRFGATLVALGNAGASTEKDIIEMGLRIAGAGNQVGLSQAQVLSFASALSSVGINAEAGGSAISRVFLKINDAVAKGGEDLAEFARIAGMSSADFKQAFETDAAGATTAFIAGLGRIKGEGENVNATLEGVVGKNIILKDTLLRASGAGALLSDSLALGNKAWQENTALVKEAAERYKTFEREAQKLWAQVRDVGIELGTALLPTMRDLVAVAQPVVAGIAEMAKWFSTLPQGVRTTTLVIGALVAALGPALYLFGQIALGAQAVVAAFAAKGIATQALTYVMATATGQAGLLGMALTALGAAAAVAATAFAAWKLGGWIGEITGATDAVGKLTAATGEWLGILPKGTTAQYDASRAAANAKTAVTSLATAQTEVAKTAAAAVPPVQRFTGAVKESTKETKEHEKAAKKAAEATDRFRESVTSSIRVWTPYKTALQDGTTALRNIADGLNANGTLIVRTTEEMEEAARATAEWIRQNGLLKGSIQAIGPELETEVPKWTARFETFAAGLGNIILGAFQGGGDAIKSAGAFAGNELGKWLSSDFGAVIKSALPFGIGSAITALLPSLGAILGPLADKMADWFKRIFGGPSKDELKGRELVKDFEKSLEGMLTDAQKAEAGNEAWKATVIALRDAYIAAGRTAEEAEADAKRLWESSKEGADAAARVIEDIKRKIDALPTNKTIDIDVNYNDGTGAETTGSSGFTAQALPSGERVMADIQSGATGVFKGSSGSAGTTVTNNYLPVVLGAGMSSRQVAQAAASHLASTGLPLDEGGITTAIESVIENYLRTYSRA